MLHPWMEGEIIVQEVATEGDDKGDDHADDKGDDHGDDKGDDHGDDKDVDHSDDKVTIMVTKRHACQKVTASATGMLSDGTMVSVWTFNTNCRRDDGTFPLNSKAMQNM